MKLIFLTIISIALSSCGEVNRTVSQMTGSGSEVCQDHVLYLQFTSGSSVKYLPDGKIATC